MASTSKLNGRAWPIMENFRPSLKLKLKLTGVPEQRVPSSKPMSKAAQELFDSTEQ
jgi:hypothetical protein